MMRVLTGAQVFDGSLLHPDRAVLLPDSGPPRIVTMAGIPDAATRIPLAGGTVMPGFVDLQVNGGGGVMLGEAPHDAVLDRMVSAHRGLGTNGLLPTLITDAPRNVAGTIEVVAQAVRDGMPGVLGLHLEGPHLDPVRKGAHDPGLIRPMAQDDLDLLLQANDRLPNLMVTLAPAAVATEQIETLARAGVIVSLGHSDCDYDTAMRAFDAGARCATHLFNAMSPLASRAPGLVGAVLDAPAVSAGLIADGIHVHPATIRAALAAKRSPGELFLVTDAMAFAGSDARSMTLNDREITRKDGRLTLPDGTLAGADLDMARAIGVMIDRVGDDPARAMARATSIPAGVLRDAMGMGGWPTDPAMLIHVDAAYGTVTRADRL